MSAAKRRTKAERDELDMVHKLRTNHGYMFAELRHKADRITTTFHRTPDGSFKTGLAVCIRLVVPEDSVLGKDIIAGRKKAEQKKARSLAAKETGGWIRPDRIDGQKKKVRAPTSKARRPSSKARSK